MSPSAVRLRSLWFQLHKWLGHHPRHPDHPDRAEWRGLVWHDWLDEQINPQRFPAAGGAALPPSTYAENAVRLAEPGERVSSIRLPGEAGAVQVTLMKPLPDGVTASACHGVAGPEDRRADRAGRAARRCAERAACPARQPDGPGRRAKDRRLGRRCDAAVVADRPMAVVAAEGQRPPRLRWNRRPDLNSNLHFQAGFWISLPLAVLSATGVWISFPRSFSGVRGGPPGAGPLATRSDQSDGRAGVGRGSGAGAGKCRIDCLADGREVRMDCDDQGRRQASEVKVAGLRRKSFARARRSPRRSRERCARSTTAPECRSCGRSSFSWAGSCRRCSRLRES